MERGMHGSTIEQYEVERCAGTPDIQDVIRCRRIRPEQGLCARRDSEFCHTWRRIQDSYRRLSRNSHIHCCFSLLFIGTRRAAIDDGNRRHGERIDLEIEVDGDETGCGNGQFYNERGKTKPMGPQAVISGRELYDVSPGGVRNRGSSGTNEFNLGTWDRLTVIGTAHHAFDRTRRYLESQS
jgi:hypothetical protein